MKKIISLILALAMICAVLVSCTTNKDPDADTTAANQTKAPSGTSDPGNNTKPGDGSQTDVGSVPSTDTNPSSDSATTPITDVTGDPSDTDYVADFSDLDYGNVDVKVLSRSHSWVADEIWAEGQSGNPISDAVFNRNSLVEKELGVVIHNDMIDGDSYAVTEQLRVLRDQNSMDYDFFANSVYATIMYTNEGMFADLYKCEGIDFEAPFYSQGFIDVASAGNSLYMITGSLALSMYRFIFATFFNEKMIEENISDVDLYDVVDSGKWTLSYQFDIAEKIYTDDGDGIKNDADTFGFLTNGDQIGVDAYWSSCDLRIVDKTNDNWYEYKLDISRLSNAVDSIINLVWNCKGTYSYAHTSGDGEQADIRAKFANGGGAMATLRLIEAESSELRDMMDVYGVIPIPKLEESQKEYRSYSHDQMTAFGIPSWLSDDQLQRAGNLFNAMSYYSYKIVQPDYYELTLKAKYMDNERSWEMLDMIINNLYVDAGVLYTKVISSVHQQLRSIVGSKKNTVASAFGSKKVAYIKCVDKLNAGIKAIQK